MQKVSQWRMQHEPLLSKIWVWQLILAQQWQLTLAHLWQFAKHHRGMEIRWASGWSVAEARSPARASISPSA